MENQELIVVEQLPIIKEQLKNVSAEIDKEVEEAKSLICTEENIKTVKEVRAKLNNTFKLLEEQRKNVKNSVMQPYNDFEKVYKECVSDKFKSADIDLKNKIDTIEKEAKQQKENEIREYFEEYKQANNIDFITYEQTKINVTLTASKKSLKEQAKAFIDKIVDDLQLIETQEHKAEILVEYKQTLNVSNAITTVTNRFKAIEEEKKKQEELKEQFKQEPIVIFENKKEIKASNEFVVVPIKREITIKINAFDKDIEKLKRFLEVSNIEYESEEI